MPKFFPLNDHKTTLGNLIADHRQEENFIYTRLCYENTGIFCNNAKDWRHKFTWPETVEDQRFRRFPMCQECYKNLREEIHPAPWCVPELKGLELRVIQGQLAWNLCQPHWLALPQPWCSKSYQ